MGEVDICIRSKPTGELEITVAGEALAVTSLSNKRIAFRHALKAQMGISEFLNALEPEVLPNGGMVMGSA